MSRKRRKKKKNDKGMNIIVFVVIVFVIAAGARTLSLRNTSRQLSKRQEILQNQLESEEQRTKDLEAKEKYMKTKKYMEEVAREKLGLVYPNEILIEPSNK